VVTLKELALVILYLMESSSVLVNGKLTEARKYGVVAPAGYGTSRTREGVWPVGLLKNWTEKAKLGSAVRGLVPKLTEKAKTWSPLMNKRPFKFLVMGEPK